MQVQITPRYVNPPKDPSWSHGSIKDTNNQLYSVDKNHLGLFQQNVPVIVTLEQKPNQKYPQIIAVNGQALGFGPAPAPAGMTPIGQAMPQIPQPMAPPPISQEMDKAMHIFVTGIIGRALHGTGSVPDYNTLSSMVYNARRAFIEGMAEPITQDEPQGQEGPPAWHDAPPV